MSHLTEAETLDFGEVTSLPKMEISVVGLPDEQSVASHIPSF